MHYIEYLKLYIYGAAWAFSGVIIIYGVICYLGSIQPIYITTEMITHGILNTILTSLLLWWFDNQKQNK